MSFKKILITLLALLLCASMVVSLAACKKDNQNQPGDEQSGETDNTPKPTKNDTQTLIIQESTFDGVYSPFFYSSAYDGDVVGMVNVGLLTVDPTGAVVAGNQYDTVGLDYSIFYTNDLATLAAKGEYEEGDYVVYEIVLKNGAKFSDGSAITADDVLFNYYVYLDPAYSGSSTLYTLPILGLAEYRTQTTSAENAMLAAKAAAIYADGKGEGYVANENYTEEEYTLFWNTALDAAGEAFAQDIINYVAGNYSDYVSSRLADTLTWADVKDNINLRNAFGARMWGFGSFNKTAFVEGKTYYTQDPFTYTAVAADATFDEKTVYYTLADETYTKAAITEFAEGVTYYTQDAPTYTAYTGDYKAGTYYLAQADGTYTKALLTDFEYGFYGAGTGKNYGTLETIEFTTADYWNELQAVYTYTPVADGASFNEKETYYIFNEDAFETAEITEFAEGVTYYTNSYDANVSGVVDYDNLNETETAGSDLIALATEKFIAFSANVGSIASIEGLKKGTKTVNGEEHETVTVILTEQNPKAVLSLGVTIAPKAYYTAGYTYPANALVNYGVENGINGNVAFMNHLKTRNAAPMGAGVYKFVSADGDGVTLVRNDYHYTMGDETVTNALIKNVYLKVVTSGQEYNALKAGDVHYANPSADADVVGEIANIANLTSILVDNLGYGYICINPKATEYGLDNLYARIALTTVIKLPLVNEYYPNGLADVIYRSQSQVSWAYPENATAIYEYDETLASAIKYFKLAGYNYDEATGKFTDVPAYDFYLPSDASDHPAGRLFLNAQALLETIGITANIKVDSNLISDIKTNAIPVYALAWQSSQDPDMYQVYHYQSQAESVSSNGIQYLYANGTNADLGTIEVTKLDGNKETMTQSQALGYLAELIEEGVKYMSTEERKPIYEKALEVLAQLNIELPTYQRKNMFAYDNTIIDATTLSATVTPYWGPIAQIWKLSFVNGTAAAE